MSISLRRTITVTIILVFLVLAALLALGIRQYQANFNHQEIVAQTEKVIFQFAIIREHLIESILSRRFADLPAISQEMEELRENLSAIVANAHIPDQYKLTFLNQVDLPGIILLLRKMGDGEDDSERTRQLTERIRILGERLMLFDRVIINSAKKSLFALQSLIIGVLAISVFALVAVLFMLYRRMAAPIMGMVRQVGEIRAGNRKKLTVKGRCEEIDAVTGLAGELIQDSHRSEEEAARYARAQRVAVQLLKAMQEAASEEALLVATCKAFLADEDCCLAWIGVADEESSGLKVLAVDGSTTMTLEEYRRCLESLRKQSEEQGPEEDHALQALYSGQAVVASDILAGLPQGPFKNTPFYRQRVSCVALPMISNGATSGVVAIYSIEPDFPDEREVAVLQVLADGVAFSMNCLGHDRGGTELFRASQLAAIGELAADIAHEINNLSNGIINYAQILADESEVLGLDFEHKQLLGKVIKEGERIAAISGRLLACSDGSDLGIQHFRLDQVINEALGLLSHRLRSDGIEVGRFLQDDLPPFTGNRQKILHLLLNLFNNGLQALNRRYPGKDDNKLLQVRNELVSDEGRKWLRVVITDHGLGIAEEHLKKVFDQDFTTNPPGAGSGLGLTISREIVNGYGGRIRIDSQVDDHTSVIFDLPVHLKG